MERCAAEKRLEIKLEGWEVDLSPSRREFIKQFGIALAGLLTTRCALPGQSKTPRDQLRFYWQRFDWLAGQSRDWKDPERGDEARERLNREHREALDTLVSAGELAQPVADLVQTAFEAATYHVWRSNAAITCYEPMIVEYRPTASSQLVVQSAWLAGAGDLDPATVAQAQAAIERDMAFLQLTNAEVNNLYRRLIDASEDGRPIPQFDDLDLEVTAEAVQAAQFLIELLVEG